MAFSPASRTTLTESIMEQLLAKIQRGELKPGDRLPPERDLMEQFGVGRSTVREALQSLARMHLIESRPGSGTVVKPFDIKAYLRPDVFAALLSSSDADELLESREIMEVAIIGLAAQRATPEDIAMLAEVLQSSSATLERGEPTYELSALFHVALARAAHNAVLLNFMHSIYELLRQRGQRTTDLPSFLLWEIESHTQLYDLVRAGDVEGAQRMMRDHLRHSAHEIGEI